MTLTVAPPGANVNVPAILVVEVTAAPMSTSIKPSVVLLPVSLRPVVTAVFVPSLSATLSSKIPDSSVASDSLIEAVISAN